MRWMKAVADHVVKTRSADLNKDLESGVFTVGHSSDKKSSDVGKDDWKYDATKG